MDNRGIKKPLFVEEISNNDALLGFVVPIPRAFPLLKKFELFTTHCEPFQYGVFPATEPLVSKPAGPWRPVAPVAPCIP